MKKVIIVDENDKQIGLKNFEDIKCEDIYRVSALWIENSKGEILIAQRSFKKENAPGKWGPAVAGTVEEDEDYDLNIYKETEEEIGLTGEKFLKSIKKRRTGNSNFFCQWYFLRIDKDIKDFKLQEDEVEAIRWISQEQLKKEVENNPDNFLTSLTELIDFFKDIK